MTDPAHLDDLLSGLLDGELGPADEAAASARLPDDVQAAIRKLPVDYRTAVVLCDVMGLQYDEIGAALDVPVGTVRSRIHRGRALLRKALT